MDRRRELRHGVDPHRRVRGLSTMSDELTDPTEPADERVVEYKRAIESIVLVAHDPVPAELLAQLLEEPTVMIEQWCEELAASYVASGHGFELVHIAGGWRFQTASDLTPYVERFLLHDQRARLSGAALRRWRSSRTSSRSRAADRLDPRRRSRRRDPHAPSARLHRRDRPRRRPRSGDPVRHHRHVPRELGLATLDDLPPIAEFIPSAEVVEALETGSASLR